MNSEMRQTGEILTGDGEQSFVVLQTVPVLGRAFVLVAPMGEAHWAEMKDDHLLPVSEADMGVLRAVAGAQG